MKLSHIAADINNKEGVFWILLNPTQGWICAPPLDFPFKGVTDA
jgi:hypothetical protein